MPEGVEDGGGRSSKAANAANDERATGSAASDESPTNDAPSVNARMDENAGRPVGNGDEDVACPYCGSTDTHVENARGPSLCRTIYHCDACESPFERFG